MQIDNKNKMKQKSIYNAICEIYSIFARAIVERTRREKIAYFNYFAKRVTYWHMSHDYESFESIEDCGLERTHFSSI